MPHIGAVEVCGDRCIKVEWIGGPRVGITEIVDLSPLINKYRFYAPLRDDRDLFATVNVADEGTTLEWADGEFDMPATNVEELAEGQMTGKEFEEFLNRHKLTRQAAAAELGRSLRAIQSYVKSVEPLPRVVTLACLGYEAQHRMPEKFENFDEFQTHFEFSFDPITAANDDAGGSYYQRA